MKNNIKKAPVKFQEDLLYFLTFYADFCLCPKFVIITTLKEFASLEKTLSLRVDPVLEDFLHSEKQHKVKKLFPFVKLVAKHGSTLLHLNLTYHIYWAIRQGFSLYRMTSNY